MRAIQLATPGRPLVDADVEPRWPEPGEVMVAIEAAGICRSDLHYRGGFPAIGDLPRTLGHEIAGTVVHQGAGPATVPIGSRVCLHYLVTCGTCGYCRGNNEQFCGKVKMLGKDLDGGFAEFVTVPARNAMPIPEAVSTTAAAVMMCSTATVYHAMRVGSLAAGERVVIFGGGGLGQSAVQLAVHFGAEALVVEPNRAKRRVAESFGATAIDPGDGVVEAVLERFDGGADLALDLVGSATVVRHALDVLAPMGTAVAVGLTADSLAVGPYTDLVIGERRLAGSSDHRLAEIGELLSLAADGVLDIDALITRSVPRTAAAMNGALDDMAQSSDDVRTVVER